MFYLAISLRVYRHTLPYGILVRVFGEDYDEGPFAALTLLRKSYSIVAFAMLGFIVDRALPPIRRRALRAALIIGCVSAVIEVAQKARGAREDLLSEAIDVACGAVGGWLGVTIAQFFSSRHRPER